MVVLYLAEYFADLLTPLKPSIIAGSFEVGQFLCGDLFDFFHEKQAVKKGRSSQSRQHDEVDCVTEEADAEERHQSSAEHG
jgi:hypothetical protein